MVEQAERWIRLLQVTGDWLLAQPLPVQVVAGAVGLAVLWVSWILLRVILVAFRATFRGL